jgi:bla regulator protein blaR1
MILITLQGPNLTWFFESSPKILSHLIDPAVRSLAIASAAGLVMVVAQIRSLSLRLSVWKAVICVALGMPLLAMCLPPLRVRVPVPEGFPGLADSTSKAEISMASRVTQPAVRTSRNLPTAPASIATIYAAPTRDSSTPHNSYSGSVNIPRSTLALGVYSAGALFLAFRFLLGWFLSYKLRQASRAIHDIEAGRRFRCHCDAAQLRTVPRFAESDRLSVPLTCGVIRPFVLLPADWRTWDTEKLDAVMAHEISHVARRDALTERLALLHRSLFWFSPLAWWLPRCLADLAEEASDEAALAAGTEPTKYAEVLLGFLEDLNSASCRAHWQGVAMAQAGSAEKRLDRILQGRSFMSAQTKKSAVAVLIFASVPVVLVAASLQPHRLGPQIVFSHYPSRAVAPAIASQQSSATVPAAPAEAAVPAQRATPVTVTTVAPVTEVSPTVAVSTVVKAQTSPTSSLVVAPVVTVSAEPKVSATPDFRAIPVVSTQTRIAIVPEVSARILATPKSFPQAQSPTAPPTPPVPPVSGPSAPPTPPAGTYVPAPPRRNSSLGSNPLYSYSYSESDRQDGGDSYAIISGKMQTMSGSFSHMDFAKLDALRKKINGDFIWFERDGKSYVITDPETVKRATEAFAAQAELGRQEGELGERQGRLGEVQGALGEQQGVLGEQMGRLSTNWENMKIEIPDMTAELKDLQLKTQELSQAISQKNIEEMHTSMEQMRKEIAEATKNIDQAKLRAQIAQSVDSKAIEQAMSQARATLDEQMAKFSEQQEKLGQQMERLGKEQEELARRQSEASEKAQAELKAIIDQSISRGTAQPAPKQ